MATTKTIQPTGATITIPAFTDQPDARVFSTDVDNITDAVNSTNQALSTLNSNKLNGINTQGNNKLELRNSGGVVTFISHATTPSETTPSVWFDIRLSNKTITFYKDVGNGFVSLGTLQLS